MIMEDIEIMMPLEGCGIVYAVVVMIPFFNNSIVEHTVRAVACSCQGGKGLTVGVVNIT